MGKPKDSEIPASTNGRSMDEAADGPVVEKKVTAEDDPKAESASAQKVPKKRTKTGCLTCRQRRIKCGEEKPICNNCIKSKRECKGYTQRVVFKNPIGIFGAYNLNQVPNAPMQSMPLGAPNSAGYYSHELSQQRQSGSNRPLLAPRPIPLAVMAQSTLAPGGSAGSQEAYRDTARHPSHQYTAPPLPIQDIADPTRPPVTTIVPRQHQVSNVDRQYSQHGMAAQFPADISTSQQSQFQQMSSWTVPPGSFRTNQGLPVHTIDSLGSAQMPQFDRRDIAITDTSLLDPSQERSFAYEYTSLPSSTSPYQTTHFDEESDDYFDVESDEEMEDHTSVEGFNQLSLIAASATGDGRQLRSFTTYLNEPNMLASYRPTLGSSPLNNPKTARIFVHFIHSTGPSLSMFERHPADSANTLGSSVPTAQQGLWTYTLPLKSLEHQALLQAILALSSLHISYLQQAPPTVSLKHYHYALKRVGTAVGLPQRRKQIGTLAATLLLAYYEVMTAEHSKWNSHVAGSAQLVREIDFATLTRDIRSHRRRRRAQRQQTAQADWGFADSYAFDDENSADDPFAEKESSIDEKIIGSILGRAVNYDQFGQIDDGRIYLREKNLTRMDIENYRIQCDLYWWYCKQDIIQGLIGGSGLMLPFSYWGQCPPRAGMGRLDAIYGSADHLWLLLARLIDFGYRDRKRKLYEAKENGKEWKPGPGLHRFMGRFIKSGGNAPPGPPPNSMRNRAPDANRQSPGTSPSSGSGYSPPMYGMIPPRGPIRLPSGFASSGQQPQSPGRDGGAETMSYEDAESEWEDILTAFENFAPALGPDFLPLPVDTIPPISTPFGPALQYRTHTIAVMWGFYYASRILLHRLHPSMPPAMMVAAGVAASTTAEYAQIIGKIAAGIHHPQWFNVEAGRLSPTLGSCLIDMTVPIFFAAVQYLDVAQRGWTISKLSDVSRLTGWRSSNAIAVGCENAWEVAGKQGRGPPYQRTRESDRQRASSEQSPQDGTSRRVSPDDNSEKRFVTINKSMHVHWAMGLLSLDDDVLNLEAEDRT